jgi:hypothetical protein
MKNRKVSFNKHFGVITNLIYQVIYLCDLVTRACNAEVNNGGAIPLLPQLSSWHSA